MVVQISSSDMLTWADQLGVIHRQAGVLMIPINVGHVELSPTDRSQSAACMKLADMGRLATHPSQLLINVV